MRLWDVATGKELWRQGGTKNRLSIPVLFTPDGKQIVTPSKEGVRVWDAATGKEVRRFGFDCYSWWPSPTVALSPDGSVLACAPEMYEGDWSVDVVLFDFASGKEIGRLKDHYYRVTPLVFSGDGKLLGTVDYKNVIRVWDMTTKKRVAHFKGQACHGGTLYFPKDAKTLVSSGAQSVVTWDLATEKQLKEHGELYTGFTVAADGHTCAPTSAGSAFLFHIDHQYKWTKFDGHSYPICSAAFSRDGKLLATGGVDHVIGLWDVAALKSIVHGGGHGSHVNGACFLPDNATVVTVSHDATLRLWDAKTGKEARRHTFTHTLISLAFSPDGQHVACAAGSDDTSLRLIDVDSGKILHTWKSDNNYWKLQFSADGKLLYAATKLAVHVFDLANKKEVKVIPFPIAKFLAFALSPDGKTLARPSVDSQHIELIDMATEKLLRKLDAPGVDMYWLAFAPNGKALAAPANGKEKGIRVWDLRSGKAQLLSHDGRQNWWGASLFLRTVNASPAAATSRKWVRPSWCGTSRRARRQPPSKATSTASRRWRLRRTANAWSLPVPTGRRWYGTSNHGEGQHRIQRMKLTGAAILVSRGMKVLQAAPAAYPYRSLAWVRAMDYIGCRNMRRTHLGGCHELESPLRLFVHHHGDVCQPLCRGRQAANGYSW